MRFGRMKNSMYKKMIIQLFLCHMLLMSAFVCAKGVQLTRIAATPAFRIWDEAEKEEGRTKTDRIFGLLKRASSGQRVVPYSVMEKHYVVELSQADYEALLKIVQAEAGNEDETGKMMVAGVVLNRVKNEKFPDTVSEVVTQRENGCYQFSPVATGSYYRAVATQDTVDAVEKVLLGEDVSGGALYFAARKYADPEKMKWFDRSLTFLYEHGGHEFYTN